MFASVVRFLTGKPDKTLPSHVAAVIEAARYLPRASDDEEGPRVAVVLAGGGLRGAFIFNRADAKKRVLARWPELSDAQVSRCVSALEAGAMNAARLDAPRKKRKGWIHDY